MSFAPNPSISYVCTMLLDSGPKCSIKSSNILDHFFSGGQIEAVLLTEASIAGGKSRTTSATFLRDFWIQASKELGIATLHDEMAERKELLRDQFDGCASDQETKTILVAEASFLSSMKIANQILISRTGNGSAIIVVTGSLHIVSSVLSTLWG